MAKTCEFQLCDRPAEYRIRAGSIDKLACELHAAGFHAEMSTRRSFRALTDDSERARINASKSDRQIDARLSREIRQFRTAICGPISYPDHTPTAEEIEKVKADQADALSREMEALYNRYFSIFGKRHPDHKHS